MDSTFFVLEPGVGNNAFSIDRKPDRSPLKVTPLVDGQIEDAKLGTEVAFQDFDGERWMECVGLEAAIRCTEFSIPFYLFDNHNQAFYGWAEGMKNGYIKAGATLVHLDAHYDDREPPNVEVDLNDLKDVHRYTNEVLQIATFIRPALQLGMFRSVRNFVESREFEVPLEFGPDEEVVLDIDLDLFCEEMSHVDYSQKIQVIKDCLPHTKLITMATSPFFIDQGKAIDMARRIVELIQDFDS